MKFAVCIYQKVWILLNSKITFRQTKDRFVVIVPKKQVIHIFPHVSTQQSCRPQWQKKHTLRSFFEDF